TGSAANVAAGLGGAALGELGTLLRPTMVTKTIGTGILDSTGKELMRDVLEAGPSKAAQAIQKFLPEKSTLAQAEKVAKIVYHIVTCGGTAAYLYHELFGGKDH